ncbi:unnamed protein product [Nippostrongylus brasiliensis]|uniref:Transporter (inferred by orthology to a C. elegans protein) n=1 Tax=Nippostrongylus brasiliensis TaxID=27835 RepID=A0A0N4YCC8_NIPBR|nr:unnamed protein product [Nippostrongylus brasiliensis]
MSEEGIVTSEEFYRQLWEMVSKALRSLVNRGKIHLIMDSARPRHAKEVRDELDGLGLAVVVQFFVCYVFAGVPVLYMEIALGQFTSSSPYRIYQMIAPAMSGRFISSEFWFQILELNCSYGVDVLEIFTDIFRCNGQFAFRFGALKS